MEEAPLYREFVPNDSVGHWDLVLDEIFSKLTNS
jgi:hypothetical protein